VTPARLLPGLVLPVLLAACSVGPAYKRPAIATPEQWAEATAGAGDPAVAGDWWRAFGSDELDRLVEQSRAASFDIRAAVARVRQAEAQAEIAGAPLLPALSGSFNGQRQRSPSQTFSSEGGDIGTRTVNFNRYSNSFSARLTASYELDFWGKNRAAAQSADASLLASRYARQTVVLTTLSSVADTYFQVLALKDRVALARQSLSDSQEVLRGIELRARVGVATALDVAQQRSLVESERASIAALQGQLVQQTNALAVLLGVMPEQVRVERGGLDGIAAPVVAAGLPSRLLARRPDVAEAEASLVAANADLRSAIAEKYPSLTLTGSGGYQSRALQTLFDPASQLWALAGSLTQSIFQGGRLEGQADLQRARVEELTASYQRAVVAAFSDVENALSGVRQATEQLDAQRAATAAAQQAFNAADAQLRRGTVDTITVLDTQRSLFQAKDALAQAQLARLQSILTLYRVLGGGWDVAQEAGAPASGTLDSGVSGG
jgi:NodT family efflux transporter outer membrane factor (OMF) lipoprotein